MIGQGVLREALLDDAVSRIVTLTRKSTGRSHAKLGEVLHGDMWNLESVADRLTGFDACIFSLGVSAFRLTETEYSRITYDLTLAIAKPLLRLNPGLTFVYTSAAGADSTERGRMMWARVKGKTENELLRLGFRRAYMFRPGLIIPMDGIRSSTPAYNAAYAVLRPLFPILRRVSPSLLTTTRQIGRAMITVAREGYSKPILEREDIRRF